ncbi:MAG: bifunctional adenosylcobinamide kinase/adenosylcobinamide-phosphate guanylyltransferase, partial [Spirochaetota bacterium]
MNNIFFYKQEERWREILNNFLAGLKKNAIIITNETGFGTIPMDEVTRRYNQYLGLANTIIAGSMDEVYVMISGIPLKIK